MRLFLPTRFFGFSAHPFWYFNKRKIVLLICTYMSKACRLVTVDDLVF